MACDDVKKQTRKDAVAFVKYIVENLQSRCPNVELYKAAKIFDPSNMPSSDHDFRVYGDSELDLLCTTYSDLVDYSKCVFKWDTLKESIKSSPVSSMQIS